MCVCESAYPKLPLQCICKKFHGHVKKTHLQRKNEFL